MLGKEPIGLPAAAAGARSTQPVTPSSERCTVALVAAALLLTQATLIWLSEAAVATSPVALTSGVTTEKAGLKGDPPDGPVAEMR